MKAVKKMLMGIAVILFGIAILAGGAGELVMNYIGWSVALVGLVLAFAGYFFTQDDAR